MHSISHKINSVQNIYFYKKTLFLNHDKLYIYTAEILHIYIHKWLKYCRYDFKHQPNNQSLRTVIILTLWMCPSDLSAKKVVFIGRFNFNKLGLSSLAKGLLVKIN